MPSIRFLKRFALVATLGLSFGTAATSTLAQSKTDPIRILVGFPAGGSSDAIARSLANGLQRELGRNVIVENRPGAGGQIAAVALKNSTPDGTTLFLSNSHTIAIVPLTMPKVGFDPIADFQPIAMVAINPDVLASSVAVTPGVDNLATFTKWAAANPDKASIGVPSADSAPEFAAAIFVKTTGVKLTVVPYRGDQPIALDLVGGHLSAGVGSVGTMIQHARAGKVKLLAVNGPRRLLLLPNVPTFAEQGIAGYEEVMMTGLYAPAGMSTELAKSYSLAVAKVVASPEYEQQISQMGITPQFGTAAELAERTRNATREYTKMMLSAGRTPVNQ